MEIELYRVEEIYNKWSLTEEELYRKLGGRDKILIQWTPSDYNHLIIRAMPHPFIEHNPKYGDMFFSKQKYRQWFRFLGYERSVDFITGALLEAKPDYMRSFTTP